MTFHFAVIFCKCSSEKSCFIEVEREHSLPTTGQAVGILIGVLLVIGRSLFCCWYEAKSSRYDADAVFLTLIHFLGEKMNVVNVTDGAKTGKSCGCVSWLLQTCKFFVIGIAFSGLCFCINIMAQQATMTEENAALVLSLHCYLLPLSCQWKDWRLVLGFQVIVKTVNHPGMSRLQISAHSLQFWIYSPISAS